METRNLQEEITELEKSKNIKVLDISTMDGVLSRSAVGSAIDSLKETLSNIDLDKIASEVNSDLKDVAQIA